MTRPATLRTLTPSSVFDEAARLVVRQVNVIPIDNKRPLGPWKRWQTERQYDLPNGEDDQYLLDTFGSNVHSLAAITGAISGIVVLDTDSTAAWNAPVELCGDRIPTTVVANTARGRHVWFKHPGFPVRNQIHLGDVPLDVRGDGGYVVVPPSLHRSGMHYSWLCSPLDLWPPAPIPELLLELLRPVPLDVRALPPSDLESVPRERSSSRYAEAALEREVDAVRLAVPGVRNMTLNTAALKLSRFFVTGELHAGDVAQALIDAARAAGLGAKETRRTILSAFKAGVSR